MANTLFQRRHYEALAKAIAEQPEITTRRHAYIVLRPALKAGNPNFNEERFLKAAKLDQESK